TEIGFHIYGVFFVHHVPKALITKYYCLQYRYFIIFIVILFQHAHTLAGSYVNLSCSWVYLARKDFEESRFTGSISANNAITVAVCKFYAYVFKKNPFPIS